MLFAIMLTWQNVDDTIACITSLKQSQLPVDRILLYDNGSKDGSAAKLYTEYLHDPVVHFTHNAGNLGFSRAVNIGIREALDAGAERLFLINNDTIVDPACLGMLTEALDTHPGAGAAMPTIVYHDRPDIVWLGGGTFNKLLAGMRVPTKDRPVSSVPREIQHVSFQTGCALLVTRKAVETVGLLDERFYFYGEDAEWSLRMRGQGIDLLYVPAARVQHKIGDISKSRISPFVMYHRGKAGIMLAKFGFPGPYILYAALLQVLVYTPFRVYQLLKGGWNTTALTAWILGLYDGMFHSEKRRY